MIDLKEILKLYEVFKCSLFGKNDKTLKVVSNGKNTNKKPTKKVTKKTTKKVTNKKVANKKEKTEAIKLKEWGEGCIDEKGTIDGNQYIFKFPNAVCTEYYIGDATGTKEQIGCMANVLKENYSVASHNIPCGTKIYIPSLKGIVNKDGVFEVEDTGGHCFDFDIFLSYDKINSVGKKPLTVYVLSWGDKKMTISYTKMTKYLKDNKRLSLYHNAWVLYLKLGGTLINFWKFNDEDKTLKDRDWYDEI